MCFKKNLKDKRVYQWRSMFHPSINNFRYIPITYFALYWLVFRGYVIKFNQIAWIYSFSKNQLFWQNRNHPGGLTTVQWWRSVVQTWVNITRVSARVTAIARKSSQLTKRKRGKERTKSSLWDKRSLSVIQYHAIERHW